MATRTMTSAGPLDNISAGELMELAQDAKSLKGKLEQLSKAKELAASQQRDAEKALAKLDDEKKAFEKAQALAEGTLAGEMAKRKAELDDRETELKRREQKLAADRERYEKDGAELLNGQEGLAQQLADLNKCETEVEKRRAAIERQENLNEKHLREIVGREEKLVDREAALEAREKAFNDKVAALQSV